MKIGIFYGSTMGYTKDAAHKISELFAGEDVAVYSVSDVDADKLLGYDFLILGTSTWGFGDLQDDWAGFIGDLEKTDLSDKKVALFGYGDGESYPDTFVDGIGEIYDVVTSAGAVVVGKVDNDDYSFESSKAFKDGVFVGLPLDDNNQADKTEKRLNDWVEQLKKEM